MPENPFFVSGSVTVNSPVPPLFSRTPTYEEFVQIIPELPLPVAVEIHFRSTINHANLTTAQRRKLTSHGVEITDNIIRNIPFRSSTEIDPIIRAASPLGTIDRVTFVWGDEIVNINLFPWFPIGEDNYWRVRTSPRRYYLTSDRDDEFAAMNPPRPIVELYEFFRSKLIREDCFRLGGLSRANYTNYIRDARAYQSRLNQAAQAEQNLIKRRERLARTEALQRENATRMEALIARARVLGVRVAPDNMSAMFSSQIVMDLDAFEKMIGLITAKKE